MSAEKASSTVPCKKLNELPPVATDWQLTSWCPDCEHYERGACVNPVRSDGSTACPFDGKELPLRAVAIEPKNNEAQSPEQKDPPKTSANQRPAQALETAIKRQIAHRTGRRIQSLEVELIGSQLVIRGNAPCYYVKQLALHEVLEFIRSNQGFEVELILQLEVGPASSEAGTQQ